VPEWPRDYGGAGLSKDEARIFNQELQRQNIRKPLEGMGIWMLGPALLKYGTNEQKKAHLPDLAQGRIRWCQGYSEPGAGSDLASLSMRCTDEGDHWLVDGSKIWTSYGDKSDCIFALVRTNTEVPKQQGISFLLIDMTTPGVTTRPIRLIGGGSSFTATFFDNVKVPKANMVGQPGQGWEIAKYLLQHERESIGSMQRRRRTASRFRAARWRCWGRTDSPKRVHCAPRSRTMRSMRGHSQSMSSAVAISPRRARRPPLRHR